MSENSNLDALDPRSQANPHLPVIVRYAGQGQCRSCGRETLLAHVFVSENPAAKPAGGPWCEVCCDYWRQFRTGQWIPVYRSRDQQAAEVFRLQCMLQQQKQAIVHPGVPEPLGCSGETQVQPVGRTDALIEVGQGQAPAMRTCFHCSKQYPADAENDHNCIEPEETGEQEIACYNHTLQTLRGVVFFSSEELAGVTDRQAFRRLLSAKIQVVGDSMLRCWEVGQERRARREENRRSGIVSGLVTFEIREKADG